jgi:hypothetical protein
MIGSVPCKLACILACLIPSKTTLPGIIQRPLFPGAPATDGLRNITGVVNGDGTVTIYAITSTVSGNGDQGADPSLLVAVTDNLAATSLPSSEKFTTPLMPKCSGA